MNKQKYFVIALVLLVLGGGFYWYELRPSSIKKDCFNKANTEKEKALNWDNTYVMNGGNLTKRADYDKIFNDEYSKCLMENGIK